MDTKPFDIAAILAKKFKMESLSEEEDCILVDWLQKDSRNRGLYNELLEKGADFDSKWLENIDENVAWSVLEGKRMPKKKNRLTLFAAASVIAILSCLGIYWMKTDRIIVDDPRFVESVDAKYKNDVLPANLGAKIILANGEEVKVDDTLSVATHANFVEDQSSDFSATSELVYHTLVVPAANFFRLTLSDGTAVWVNSNTELRFPSQFGTHERRVYLSGEAYFEVAKDERKPFYVETKDMNVRVLGTHFNVSTYGEKSKTSLSEGRVEVSSAQESVVISPGQSAEWSNGNLKVRPTNLQKDLAWKNNEFYFKEDNIVNIAQQLKLWYDLEVSFSKDVSLTDTYSGEIGRDVRLTEVLKMLEFVSDLDFKLNKNKLLITKE
ncbi:FecR family protein [Sphingobacterium sp. LRF_L2]|uniref:FecR family protein n=1 Tax=Sphingobacterium sp. LRF_L2 TaxID=3369421 RepID=UPI003F5FA6F7